MASYSRHSTTNGIPPSVWAAITEHLRPGLLMNYQFTIHSSCG